MREARWPDVMVCSALSLSMALFTLDLRSQSAGCSLPTELVVTLVGDDEVVAVLAHESCLLVCG